MRILGEYNRKLLQIGHRNDLEDGRSPVCQIYMFLCSLFPKKKPRIVRYFRRIELQGPVLEAESVIDNEILVMDLLRQLSSRRRER